MPQDDSKVYDCLSCSTLGNKFYISKCDGSFYLINFVISVSISKYAYVRKVIADSKLKCPNRTKGPDIIPDTIQIEFLDIDLNNIINDGGILKYNNGAQFAIENADKIDSCLLRVFREETKDNRDLVVLDNVDLSRFKLDLKQPLEQQLEQEAIYSYNGDLIVVCGKSPREKFDLDEVWNPPSEPNKPFNWLNPNAIKSTNYNKKQKYDVNDIVSYPLKFSTENPDAGLDPTNDCTIRWWRLTKPLPGPSPTDDIRYMPNMRGVSEFWQPIVRLNAELNLIEAGIVLRPKQKHTVQDVDINDNNLCKFLNLVEKLKGAPSKGDLLVPTVRAFFYKKGYKGYLEDDQKKPDIKLSVGDINPTSTDAKTYVEEGNFNVSYKIDDKLKVVTLQLDISIGHNNDITQPGDKYIYARLANKIDFSELNYDVTDDSLPPKLIENPSLEEILIFNNKLTFIEQRSYEDLTNTKPEESEDFIYSSYYLVCDNSLESFRREDAIRELDLYSRKGIVCFDGIYPLTSDQVVYVQLDETLRSCMDKKYGVFYDSGRRGDFSDEPIHIYNKPINPNDSHTVTNTISGDTYTCSGFLYGEDKGFPDQIDKNIEKLYSIEFYYKKYDKNGKVQDRKITSQFTFPLFINENLTINDTSDPKYSLFFNRKFQYTESNLYKNLIFSLIRRFVKESKGERYENAPDLPMIKVVELGKNHTYTKSEPQIPKEKNTNLPCYSKVNERISAISVEKTEYYNKYIKPLEDYRDYIYSEKEELNDSGNTEIVSISRLSRKQNLLCGFINIGLFFGDLVTEEEAKYNRGIYGEGTVSRSERFSNVAPGFVRNGVVRFTKLDGSSITYPKGQPFQNKEKRSIHHIINILETSESIEIINEELKNFRKRLDKTHMRPEDINALITNYPKKVKNSDALLNKEKAVLEEIRKNSSKYRLTCGNGKLGTGE